MLSITRRLSESRTELVGAAFSWQGKEERRAEARLRLDPDPAAMPLDDLSRDSQSYARPGIPFVVNTLEHSKDAIAMPGIDSDSIVLDGKYPGVPFLSRGDVDLRLTVAPKLDGVFYQAGKYVADLVCIAVQLRKRVVRHDGAVFFDSRLNRDHGGGQKRIAGARTIRVHGTKHLHVLLQSRQEFL